MICSVLRRVCAAALLVPVSGALARGPEPLDRGATLFVDVNVVPMTGDGEPVLRARSVLVRDGRIEAIGEKGALEAEGDEEGVRVIDGGGTAYLMPGLADMHIHLPPHPGEVGDPTCRTLTLLLVNGVTTARGLAGHPSHPAVRAKVTAGELLGPTLYVAGPPLHSGSVKTQEDAAVAVQDQRDAGFDLIKAHAITDVGVYETVRHVAATVRMPVAGHVTNEVGLERAMGRGPGAAEGDAKRGGQQIEHLDGFVAALQEGEKGAAFGQFPPMQAVEAVPQARVEALAARVAAAGVWNTTTPALFARVVDADAETDALRERPEMRYIADAALEAWTRHREGMKAAGHLDAAYAAAFTGLRDRIVAALDEAGAPLLAGSDSPQAFMAPGFALHEELAALVKAGLTPWEALRAATAEPARYLKSLPRQGSAAGLTADFATVEVGKRADLVLVEGDPTEDITTAGKIRGVMLRGKWLDREELDRMLEEVAGSVGKGG